MPGAVPLLPKFQFSNNGAPMVNGTVTVYLAGTVTPSNTWQDEALTILNTNPIVLDARGEAVIYLDPALSYKFLLKNSGGVTQWTQDNIRSSGTIRTDLAASSGASLIGWLRLSVGAVLTTLDKWMGRQLPSVFDFMTEAQIADVIGYTFALDHTAAIQAAINTNASIRFPSGGYSHDPVTIPATAAGSIYKGDGFFHYTNVKKTVFKARTAAQTSMFALASGADNIGFKDCRIDGDLKAQKCIDASYGAFFSLDNVGVYRSTQFGFYGKQGLARLRKVFSADHAAVGFHVYSDASITDCEFTGGTEPLKLVAGGNRLVNVWANSGTESCLTLAPFDASTNHINTSLTNVYIGETLGGAVVKPCILIQGNASQLVQQVQISNSHLVSASAPDKINIAIQIDKATDVAISNLAVLGNSASTAARHLKHFISATNTSNLSVNGGVVRFCTKNPIVLGAACYNVLINGVQFSEFGTVIAAGTEGAAILVTDSINYGSVTGCQFDTSTASVVPYMMQGGDASRWIVEDALIRYTSTSTYVPATGSFSGSLRRLNDARATVVNKLFQGGLIGSGTVNNAKQNFQDKGTVVVAGSGTGTLVTLANAAEGQSYLISVNQNGTGANNVMGYAVAYSGVLSVVRLSQSNTPGGALDMNLTASGLAIQLTLGAGFGSTTWAWTLTRLG